MGQVKASSSCHCEETIFYNRLVWIGLLAQQKRSVYVIESSQQFCEIPVHFIHQNKTITYDVTDLMCTCAG